MNGTRHIGVVILAAGLSRRMGQFKLLLPWRDSTVIQSVVHTVEGATDGEIVVVTGHRAGEVADALRGSRARPVYNSDYAAGEMLSSVQTGLRALDPATTAALLCLGDQPQIKAATIGAVLNAGIADGFEHIVTPSYQMRAGHPILLPRRVWPAVLEATAALNAALAPYRSAYRYVVVDTPSILADLDTPADYERAAGASYSE